VSYYGWPQKIWVSVPVARLFLEEQGVAVGEHVANGVLPLPAVLDETWEFNWDTGAVPSVPIHGFCSLPITCRRRPQLIACVVERDLTIQPTEDNPVPMRPQLYRGPLVIPSGQQSILDCIERCRSFADYPQIASRMPPLGDVLRLSLENDRWSIYFGYQMTIDQRIARCGQYGCVIEVDDRSGEVINSFLL